jgi:hypothetical protein
MVDMKEISSEATVEFEQLLRKAHQALAKRNSSPACSIDLRNWKAHKAQDLAADEKQPCSTAQADTGFAFEREKPDVG